MKRSTSAPGKRMPGEPQPTDRWMAWRNARTKAIANPARNKAAQKLNGSEPKP